MPETTGKNPAEPPPRAQAEAPVAKPELVKEIKLPTAVLGLAADAAGKKLYAACFDCSLYEVNPESGEAKTFGQHESFASGIALAPRHSLLISAGYDGVLQWHDLTRKRPVKKVLAHKFWSWRMAVSPDEKYVASVTGQYLAGGYDYEPLAEREPSVKLFNARTGKIVHQLSHLPPVLSLAFSPDSRHVAAGNLMGDVQVWEVESGKQVAKWNTPDFTCWGIIKSHHYIGGIYAMTFSPDGNGLIVGGMGAMRDPMSGNGKQTWQWFSWKDQPARKVASIHDGEHGNGLMETVAFQPTGRYFILAGLMVQGKWNAGFFDAKTGSLLHSLDTKQRITKVLFSPDGKTLYLAGAIGQEPLKDGSRPQFGRIS